MAKLTEAQREALATARDLKFVPLTTVGISLSTVATLANKGLIEKAGRYKRGVGFTKFKLTPAGRRALEADDE